jgi:hypothetical protein
MRPILTLLTTSSLDEFEDNMRFVTIFRLLFLFHFFFFLLVPLGSGDKDFLLGYFYTNFAFA